MAARRIVRRNAQPQRLAVSHVLGWTHMGVDHVENHLGAEGSNPRSADARELLADHVGDGVLQGFRKQ
jgi:hypothetical protein